MKKIFLLITIAFLVISCGDKKEETIATVIATENLESIRTKRTEVVVKQQELNAQLKELDAKIAQLDVSKKIPLITTFTAKSEVFNHYLELQGNVQTKKNILIYPEMSGILQKVYVKEGQKVNKGQILGRVDDGGMSLQVAQMQIQTDLAKTTFERQERLWNQKIGSEMQYLQAKSNYEALQKGVSQLQTQLNKTVVKAPFSGVIDDVITEQGTFVSPGQSQLFRIVNLRDMYIETYIPESHLKTITKNKSVEVNFPVLDKSILSTIRQVGTFINPENRSFKVEIAVPNKDKSIKPNLTAKLKINDYTNENAFLIPQSIISENANGEQYIYVLNKKENNEGVAERIIIKTGKTQGDVIEVLNGVKDGTEIIHEGARSVKHGQTVKVLNN